MSAFIYSLNYASACRYIETPDFHVKVSDRPAVVCCTSLQPRYLLWADTNGRNTAGLGEPEVNIKLSDAFRGRYALPIGGPCPVLFFIAHKPIRGKKVKGVKNLPLALIMGFYNNNPTHIVPSNCNLVRQRICFCLPIMTQASQLTISPHPRFCREMNHSRPQLKNTARYEWSDDLSSSLQRERSETRPTPLLSLKRKRNSPVWNKNKLFYVCSAQSWAAQLERYGMWGLNTSKVLLDLLPLKS